MLRRRRLDRDTAMRSAVLYTVLAALLVVGYVVLSAAFARLAGVVAMLGSSADAVAAALAALAVAGLANPVRLRIEALLDRMLYRERPARAQFLQEALETLSRAQPRNAVVELLTNRAASQLDLLHAWLILPQGASGASRTGSPGYAPPPHGPLLQHLAQQTEPTLLVGSGEKATSGVWVLSADDSPLTAWYVAGARVLIPLRHAPDGTAAPGNDDELVGVWALGARRSKERFRRADFAVLEQIAARAAVLLDYARLYDELLAQAMSRHELSRAWEIQRRLLPDQLAGWPNRLQLAARFRPARETSGDFYDVFELGDAIPDGRPAPGQLRPLQIVVGDVAGKGIAAAIVMALARATLRAVADAPVAAPPNPRTATSVVIGPASEPPGPTPGTITSASAVCSPATALRRAGRLLHRDVGRRDFVACAVAVVEPPGPDAGGPAPIRLRIANAAQVPPLLCRGGQAVELEPPGDRLPLGILADPAYEEVGVDLGPGDVVVFASDGLPEAPARSGGSGAPGELFGFERLAASAAYWADHTADAEGVAAGVWTDVTRWSGEESQHDDMTLVVLRVLWS